MGELQNIHELINQHLIPKKINFNENLWRIDFSPVSGRGIFANRDIDIGEIIFIDYPLVVGPRVKKNAKIHCVICYSSNNIRACLNGCGLPLCSKKCEESAKHLKECAFIIKLNKNKRIFEISTELFRGLVALRTFLLNENSYDLLNILTHYKGKYHSFEVELIKSKLNLTVEEESVLKLICAKLDSNTFETLVQQDDTQISLRAIYFLGSFLNHCCVPNTRHHYDQNQHMIVKASMPIKKDTEIFTSYTHVLWGTTSRRYHLFATKKFWCQCDRCKDPKEYGTSLSGLKCFSKECKGILYPKNPLLVTSPWRCDACDLLISGQKVGVIQSSLGGLLKTIDLTNLDQLISFLNNRLEKFVPLKNQIAIEIKCKIIWVLGNIENYYWSDISDEYLIFKEQLCRELVQLLTDLNIGQSTMRGFILYELYRCLIEKSLRISITQNLQDIEDFEAEGKKYLQNAVDILRNDVSAPQEIKNIVMENET